MINIVEEPSLEFRLKKIKKWWNEKVSFRWNETLFNDIMSEKYKNKDVSI